MASDEQFGHIDQPERVFIISGPSGVGKNTVAERVCDEGIAVRAVTATTRPPRPGEEDGDDYYFVTPDTFQHWLETGTLLEYNEYGGHYYGTPTFSVNAAIKRDKPVLLVIDVNGALQIKNQAPDVSLIFLRPPDLPTLERRLRGRENNDGTSIKFRLQRAKKEMSMMDQYDYTVTNDALEAAIQTIERILRTRMSNT